MFASQPARSDDDSAPCRLMIFHAIQCKPFEALVDTAAEEAVIGHRAMERLESELAQKDCACFGNNMDLFLELVELEVQQR